jgi:hypothetical protein
LFVAWWPWGRVSLRASREELRMASLILAHREVKPDGE